MTDAVHPALGATSGKWRLTAWQYIPSPLAGEVYLILNNVYNHGGPYNWTTELKCVNGFVSDDFRSGTPQPLVYDQWVQFRIEIDLGANTVSNYYNGCLISTGAYNALGGPLAIENIDLFSNGGACFWDDIVLEQPWSENFDSYPTGTVMDNVGGWFGWDNVPAAAGTAVSTFSHTGPNSLRCAPGTDAVHPGFGITSGKWTVTAWQYIATGDLAGGPVFFILNNSYTHGGPYTWSGELQFNGTTVVDDLRAGSSIPIAFDQWSEIRVVFDLGANTTSSYYNGQLVSTGTWIVASGGNGPAALANMDLFSNGGTCYWDDISVDHTPDAIANPFGTGCPGTGAIVPVVATTGLPVSGSTSFAVNLLSAAPNVPAVLLFSPLCNSQAFGSCTLYVSLPTLSLAVVGTDSLGNAVVPLSIPSGVALGTNAFMQWVVIDPAGAFAGLAFSPGLRLQIGQ